MTTKKLLETLENCKFNKKLENSEFNKKEEKIIEKQKIEPINWDEQQKIKDEIFLKSVKTIVIQTIVSIVLIAIPLYVVSAPYGKASFISIPPMLFMTLSWMAGAYWSWNKNIFTFMSVTVGAVPARLALCLAWVWIITTIPDIPIIPFVLAMMFHWILYSIVEICMFFEFSKKMKN